MSEAVETLHEDLQGLIGRTLEDRYRIDDLIGIGGMAAVFRGHHQGLKRDVAIKVLHPELTRDPQISARFDREAQSSSRLDHPNCLQVTDYGSTPEGMKFMVMQLLEGAELTSSLGSPLAPARAVELALQIIRGLEHAHEHGVIHRDLKPENVFITKDHEDREVLKLVDFGIAKIVTGDDVGERVTRVGLVFGTPQYMSPEQATGMEIDARTDVYSAGVLLYQMLAGHPPFEASDPVALLRMQVSSDPAPLPESVPEGLANVVGRMLAKQRDERFSSAREARVALESVWPELAGAGVPSEIPRTPSIRPQMDHSSIPTLIAAPHRRRVRDRLRPPVIAAAVAGVVALVMAAFWLGAATDPDTSQADADANAAGNTEGPDGPGVRPDQLAEIDRLLMGDNLAEADKLIQAYRDQHPEDPHLMWREGRLHSKQRRKKSEALKDYADAIEADAGLLDNGDFYAELTTLMATKGLEEEALDLAVRKMGAYGHRFLLEEVNREKKALSYEDRHRALEELSKNAENEKLINRKLNVALDLWQANQSLTPCNSFSTGLDEVLLGPDSYFLNPVEKAPEPEPRKEEEAVVDEADAAICATMPEKRAKVLAVLRMEFPEGGVGTSATGEGDADKKKATAKSKSKKKRAKCKKFGAAFDPDCRK